MIENGDPSPDDGTLLMAADRGNHAAFGQLFDRHVRAVFWQAHSVLHNADDAQDVTQEAFSTLWRRRDSVRIVDESVLPWLMVTARNLALNTHRKNRRHGTLTLVDDLADDPAGSPETAVESRAVRAEIDAAVARLSPIDQEIFAACIDGDLSYEQAAEQLGLTHGAVRNRLSRLRSRLRGDLADVKEQA